THDHSGDYRDLRSTGDPKLFDMALSYRIEARDYRGAEPVAPGSYGSLKQKCSCDGGSEPRERGYTDDDNKCSDGSTDTGLQPAAAACCRPESGAVRRLDISGCASDGHRVV